MGSNCANWKASASWWERSLVFSTRGGGVTVGDRATISNEIWVWDTQDKETLLRDKLNGYCNCSIKRYRGTASYVPSYIMQTRCTVSNRTSTYFTLGERVVELLDISSFCFTKLQFRKPQGNAKNDLPGSITTMVEPYHFQSQDQYLHPVYLRRHL